MGIFASGEKPTYTEDKAAKYLGIFIGFLFFRTIAIDGLLGMVLSTVASVSHSASATGEDASSASATSIMMSASGESDAAAGADSSSLSSSSFFFLCDTTTESTNGIGCYAFNHFLPSTSFITSFLGLVLIGIYLWYIQIHHLASGPTCVVNTKLRGKFAVVTGANSGVGFATAKKFAAMGATVIFACRTDYKARVAMAKCRRVSPKHDSCVFFVPLDLESEASVKKCAAEIEALIQQRVMRASQVEQERIRIAAAKKGDRVPPITPIVARPAVLDFLINNAGAVTLLPPPEVKKKEAPPAAAKVEKEKDCWWEKEGASEEEETKKKEVPPPPAPAATPPQPPQRKKTPEEEDEALLKVNYLGVVKFTELLLPMICRGRGRIVTLVSREGAEASTMAASDFKRAVGSIVHSGAETGTTAAVASSSNNNGTSTGHVRTYHLAKTMLVVYTRDLARRLKGDDTELVGIGGMGVRVTTAYPGCCDTNLGVITQQQGKIDDRVLKGKRMLKLPMFASPLLPTSLINFGYFFQRFLCYKSAAAGAETIIYCAIAPSTSPGGGKALGTVVNGGFHADCQNFESQIKTNARIPRAGSTAAAANDPLPRNDDDVCHSLVMEWTWEVLKEDERKRRKQ